MAKNFICTTKGPIVQTKAGKIRGYQTDDMYAFKGIKYATAERFMQPVPVEPWEGVVDALGFGHVAPLLGENSPNMDLLIPHRFWPESEDCLSLNVWTTNPDPSAKKAVMVWLHGGGYSAGSSIEMIAYDGDNLARYGDVVIVTVNHRLNILGYLDLSSYGDKYWNSGNAGNADLVEALKWVNANISNFGGDPGNVTIFGQSGGGGKVINLVQTPAADGLFQRGIMMSGGAGRRRSTDRYDREIVDALLKELGESDVNSLETVEWDDLKRAVNKITSSFAEQGLRLGMLWAPVQNDWYAGSPWDVGYTEHAKTVPLMIGSVIAELGFMANIPDKNEVSVEKRRELIAGKFGEEVADELIAEWKKAFPCKNELGIMPASNRMGTLEFIEKRANDCDAPVFSYLFTYEFPYDGGMPAWHCADIPYAFHNMDRVDICNEPGVSDALQDAYFGAYVAFAKTGDPNGAGLANWPAYTAAEPYTMFFDKVSEAGKDRDLAFQKVHETVAGDPFAAMQRRNIKITF